MLANILLTVLAATPGSFTHNFDLHGDYSQYLYSATNVQVYTEDSGFGAFNCTYFVPVDGEEWADVVYKYDLGFPITEASLYATMNIWSGAIGDLEVSRDGLTWTTVASGWHEPKVVDGQIVPNPPVDVTDALEGSQTAYVRGHMLQGDGLVQFLRTTEQERMQAPYVYQFYAAPEPATSLMGLVAALGLWQRRPRSGNAR